ncbi:MAG: hypothetical protein GOV01_00560 [Candidatus Altiarchaeota archaeon]|nr:hypothetical protein [Candidatus Altiarchaeota archaeon]
MDSSMQYDKFLEEQKINLSLYEKAAKWANKFMKLEFEYQEYDKEMEAVELYVRFQAAMNLGIIVALLTLPLALFVYITGNSSITNWVAIGMPFIAMFSIVYYPLYIARLRKLKILGQAPLATLYLVIAMEVTPNLESSVAFAAKNVPDPMGRIFKHLLWMVETRTLPDMEAAINWYSVQIKEWAPHVAEGLYLIAGSMREAGHMRTRTLKKAVNVVLEGTQRMMEDFARGLDLPVMATNAFGIMLPVLMLVMLPIISVFTSTASIGPAMLLIYDFILPAALGGIIIFILGKRPGSLSGITYKKTKFRVRLLGQEFYALPIMIFTGFIFFVLQLVIIVSDPGVLASTVAGLQPSPSIMTMPIILAIGVPVGLYFLSWAQENRETKRRIEALEREFASALYQLGNTMSQGVPIEQAMGEVASRMKGSETEIFFSTAISRMKTLGWPLEMVLFDEKYGIMNDFPSHLIKNIMLVVLKSSEKGPTSASVTSISVSKYLKVMQDVKDKIIDMLSESISSIKFQGMFLIPIITGTVVGLGEITSNLLVQIGTQISSITQLGAVSGIGYVSDFLNVEGALQPSYLQLVVGVYVLMTCIILGLFVGGMIDGWDKMAMYENMGAVTLFGSITYVLSAAFVAMVFGGLAQSVI